jgi:alkaline phosphatase D
MGAACVILACGSAAGQGRPGTPQYDEFQSLVAISQIVDGDVDAAIKHYNEYLYAHPGDAETLYGLAVGYAQKHDIDTAIRYVEEALEEGLPFERFVVGPRDLLRPLHQAPAFQELQRRFATEFLQGPMLGDLTDHGVRVWVRTAHEVPVQVVVTGGKGAPIRSSIVRTARGKDYTAVLSVDGLQPATDYSYELWVDGVKHPMEWAFRTFPTASKAARFQIGFGGGGGYNPKFERMWSTIASHHLPAFLLLGDNIYIDNPTRPAVQQYAYYRRQSRPEYRTLGGGSAIYAIWDDHDFSTNDQWGGPDIDLPAWKIPVWELYRNNWNNPAYGGGEGQPGVWFDFAIADVDFIMLDGRYYRTDPKDAHPSMLGPVQKAWLLDRLKSSTATFKVLVSGVPWAFSTKPGSPDTWEGYKDEREEIFSFLEANKIDGVVLLSADRHRSDAWKIDRPNGYDLYEFESSKLTNTHTHKSVPGALFSYDDGPSFGLLTFDTSKPDPEVTYEIVSIDDKVIHTMTVKKSQLTHEK